MAGVTFLEGLCVSSAELSPSCILSTGTYQVTGAYTLTHSPCGELLALGIGIELNNKYTNPLTGIILCEQIILCVIREMDLEQETFWLHIWKNWVSHQLVKPGGLCRSLPGRAAVSRSVGRDTCG
jgi:hypothetical protein